MFKKFTPVSFLLTLSVLMLGGCTASISTNTGKPAANTPANTASNTAAATKKADKPKPPTEKLKDEKKPEGDKGKVAAKNVEIPKDWIDIYDSSKGYSFSVPDGTTGGSSSADGVDVFAANTPAPSEIRVMVVTYKNEKLSKEDLLNDAVKILDSMGEKVTAGKLTSESENYSLADATSTGDGAKSKYKILVGTDVTDNYVMIVGTDEAKFAANEKVIDEIWGSFEMWSGGASGNH